MATTEHEKTTKVRMNHGGRQMLAQIVLTPAESKKIIAKAIAKLDVVNRPQTKELSHYIPAAAPSLLTTFFNGQPEI